MLVTDRFVFLHIPKTGGTFIQTILRDHLPFTPHGLSTHAPHRDLPAEWQRLPVVCVVRNPWDWYVSWYHWALQRAETRTRPRRAPQKRAVWEQMLDSGRATFREAVTRACSGASDHPLAPLMQRDGIDLYSAHVRDIAGPVLDREDFAALRFERLRRDLVQYLDDRGMLSKLLRRDLRQTAPIRATHHDSYAAYYDAELQELVGARAGWLCERFGYRFRPFSGPDGRKALD
jgi:Sulfotransferase domain